MKRTKVLAIAGSIALAAGAMVSIPSTAQAASVYQCGATTAGTTWFMEGYIGVIEPCYEVEVRISVYNNYGLAGTYTKISKEYADLAVPRSVAPGTYATHSYRDLVKGKSWSSWMSVVLSD